MTAFLIVLAILIAIIALPLLGLFLFSRRMAAKVEAGMPPAGQFTDVKGGRIHWLSKGEGRPVVMIHGLSGNLHNFTYATARPLAADYRVIAVDRPGCGYSTRDRDDLARIPEQARMIAEFLEKEGIEKPLIVGHSLGGAVALTLAVNHPERVGGLALVSPLVEPQDEAPPMFRSIDISSPLIRRLIAETIAVPMAIRRGAKTLALVFAPDRPPADFGVKGGGLLSLRPDAFYATSTDLHAVPMDLPGIAPRYGEISVPAGVLYGAQDRVLDAQTHLDALQAALPEIEIVTLPETGHMPLAAAPEETESFIRRMADRTFA